MHVPVITIDGPSGSGKGTISLLLAEELGWHHLDSGVLYRLLACAALKESVALDDPEALTMLAARLQANYRLPTRQHPQVLLDGEEVGETMRSEVCGNAASELAVLPAVRRALLEWQQHYRQPPGLVADGRDMGTVVFPDADLKLYLVARPEVRALRRYNQMKSNGIEADLAEMVEAVEVRDRRDSARQVSPLKPAVDALIVDNSDLDETETLRLALEAAHKVI